MSQQLPGVTKVLVKIPREEWVLLQRFKGGSDSDRILRILEQANKSLTGAIERQIEAKKAQEKPSLIHRVFGGKA